MIDERLKGVGDLAGVSQIVVEDQRYQRHRWRAAPVKDPLVFVTEYVQTAPDLVT